VLAATAFAAMPHARCVGDHPHQKRPQRAAIAGWVCQRLGHGLLDHVVGGGDIGDQPARQAPGPVDFGEEPVCDWWIVGVHHPFNRGMPAGSEFLDVITPQFVADLISWGAIGARTTESQIHRELSSGSSMPIGFKNGTDGSVQVAVDAIGAARHPHHFLSVTKQSIAAIVTTTGNDACHLILRGSNKGPNYSAESLTAASAALQAANLPDYIMVDCSHGNSCKDHTRQSEVVTDLCEQLAAGSKLISGVMLESHLKEGKQSHTDETPLVYGQSITDACMSWEQTEPLLRNLASAVRARRNSN
jgi:3-deoxy-7-phosphoheptulonate synthase